eukprot:scaffold13490_cov58-Phaeocystis_antarctica.AAC.2
MSSSPSTSKSAANSSWLVRCWVVKEEEPASGPASSPGMRPPPSLSLERASPSSAVEGGGSTVLSSRPTSAPAVRRRTSHELADLLAAAAAGPAGRSPDCSATTADCSCFSGNASVGNVSVEPSWLVEIVAGASKTGTP